MWLVAFGYGMGALVGELSVNGTQVPYPVSGQRLDLHERHERREL